jgi:trimeric autotransporter adhesin
MTSLAGGSKPVFIVSQFAMSDIAGGSLRAAVSPNAVVVGTGGNDTLTGTTGNDTLDGGVGADSLIGRTGNDTYVIDDAGDVVVEIANQGTDTVQTSLNNLSLDSKALANVENLVLFGNAGSVGTGNVLNNLIVGSTKDDTLSGGLGNDTLDGAAGTDSLAGGKGNDVYVVDRVTEVVTENANEGIDTIQSSVSFSIGALAAVENLILLDGSVIGEGNALANAITGNSADNDLSGGTGNDTLIGGGGKDTLLGGAIDVVGGDGATDLMIGGAGDDTYAVNDIGDKVVEASTKDSGRDLVFASVNYTLVANVERLNLLDGAANGTGNASDNEILGNAAANKLLGLAGRDSLDGADGNDTLDGGTGDDSLIGSLGLDSLLGGVGNDTLSGVDGGFADTLSGGAGNDVYIVEAAGDAVVEAASQGIDMIETSLTTFTLDSKALANVENLRLVTNGASGAIGGGNGLNNLIVGTNNNDSLFGGLGNDTLNGGLGSELLTGGKGNDTYIVDDNDTVIENADEGIDTIHSSVSTSINNLATIENLVLLDGAVDGSGNAAANVITGNDADNELIGFDGNDTLIGGSGGDGLFGGIGVDLLIGGNGSDFYDVDNSADKIIETASNANSDDDTVVALVSYVLSANVENLTLVGDLSINGVGNASGNQIVGNDGNNKLLGLSGNDDLSGNGGNDTLDGGAGIFDFLNGGAGNDQLIGGAGTDFLDGGSATDTMAGGTGNDEYTLDEAGDVIVEASGQGVDTVVVDFTTPAFTLSNNLENLILSDNADDGKGGALDGTGNSLNNKIEGNGNANRLTGLLGNDTLDGRAGTDTLVGGKGNDLYVIDDLGDLVTELANEGIDTVVSFVNNTSLAAAAFANVENLELEGDAVIGSGSAAANRIVGNGNGLDSKLSGLDGNDTLEAVGGNNTLLGGNGNDRLVGNLADPDAGGGADSLDGGAGVDIMIGRSGDDIYVVDTAADKVVEAAGAGEGFDTVTASVSYVMAANVERLILADGAINGTGNASDNDINGNAVANKLLGLAGNDDLSGNGDNDTLDGGTGNDELNGGDGDDRLLGGAGNDELSGSVGNDTLEGGAGDDSYVLSSQDLGDQIIEGAGQGIDLLIAFGGDHTLAANVENMDLRDSARGTGNALGNRITGDAGGASNNNTMSGLDGNDTLIGGFGADVMTGGNGRDTFVIGHIGGAAEIVTDFTTGTLGDKLDVSDLLTGFTAGSSNAADFVQFVNAGGNTTVRVDADGAANGANFVDVCVLQGVTLNNVAQAVTDGSLLLS